jgi:hypothetical protein
MSLTSYDPTERLIAASRERLLESLRNRFDLFAPAVVRDSNNQPLDLDMLHLAWLAHVEFCWEHGFHAGIFSPHPSASFSALLAAWLIGRDLRASVKIVTNVDASSRVRFRAIRSLVASRKYEQIFDPQLRPGTPRWSGDNTLAIEATGQAAIPILEARGVQSRTASLSATHLIFDCVSDSDNSSTHEKREATKALVNNWLERLTPGGRVLWIASYSSPDDVSYAMRARRDFLWLTQSARSDATGYDQEIYGAPDDYLGSMDKSLQEYVSR